MKVFLIRPNDAGQRLDRFVAKAMPSLPFSLIQKGLRTKKIKLNGKRATAGAILAAGQTVDVYLRESPAREGAQPWRLASWSGLDIIYEDGNVLLCNKEAGLTVHPDNNPAADTLITRALAYLYASGQWDPDGENSFTPALAHRLDRNTSGLVLAAKTAAALRVLNQKFRNREIDKAYLCLVIGRPKPDAGTLRHYLKRDRERCRVEVRPDRSDGAKTALTAYRVLGTHDGMSLVECRPLTGRTHQIRAQWAAVGHPLLGDGKYGAGSRDRDRNRDCNHNRDKPLGFSHQALCAYRLSFAFTTPSGCLEYLRGKTFELPEVPFATDFAGWAGHRTRD